MITLWRVCFLIRLRTGTNLTIKNYLIMTTQEQRLEELRTELRTERISYGELFELQSLIECIEQGDVELLEAAGVPEFE